MKTPPMPIVGSPVAELIYADLQTLQSEKEICCVIVEQVPVGYGAQISRRVLGLMLGLALRRQAVFLQDDDPPYHQSLEKQHAVPVDEAVGWILFNPTLQQDWPCLFFKYDDANRFLLLDPTFNCSIEAWIQDRIRERYCLGIEADVAGLILSWMQWREPFVSVVDDVRDRLQIKSDTLGVHFRRGDKNVESAYLSAEHINRAIRNLYEQWHFKSIFLASDSPSAHLQIEVPNGVLLIFDHHEIRYDNANHKMLFRKPNLALQETFTATKNLLLLASCGGIVGQDNVHFATLAGAIQMYRGVPMERVILLNGHATEHGSLRLAFYFALKRRVRRAIRSALPAILRKRLLGIRPR